MAAMNSPFKQYLGTNYPPLTSEVKRIHHILESLSQEASLLDSEIDHLQRQLDALQQKRSMITDFMEQHRKLISPVRRLADDIIVEIFMACLPEFRNPCISAREAPMLLTHICKSWRELALSTPQLWAAVHIVLPSIPFPQDSSPPRSVFRFQEDVARRTLDLRRIAVKEWLDRSGACSLSISVFGNNERAPPGLQVLEDYFTSSRALQQMNLTFIREIIVPYHRRWGNLSLFITHEAFKELLESGLKAESLEMLESLSVRCGMNNSLGAVVQDKWEDILHSLVPSHATSVKFYGIPFDSSAISVFAIHNWSKLTELDLHLIGSDVVDVASTVVSRCKHLKALKLNFWDALTHRAATPTERIVLRHLEILTLSMLSPDVGARSFVKRLHLPNLRELDFQFGRSSDPALFEISEGIIKSLVAASENFSSLRLSLPTWLNSHSDLIRLLTGMPYLKCLRLSSYQSSSISFAEDPPEVNLKHVVNDDLLLALMSSGKEYVDIICPVLQSIICDFNVITGVSEPVLKEFVWGWNSDQYIAGLGRQLSVAVNDYKMEDMFGEERVSLGEYSSIYFRKHILPNEISSPYMGIEGYDDLSRSYVNSRYDVYHEL